MRVRFGPAVIIALLTLFGCSSSTPSLIEPDVAVRVAGGFPAMRAGVDVPMTFDIYVRNNSAEPMTILQARLESWGTVSYSVRSRLEYFQETIPPGQTAKVTMSGTARANSTRSASAERLTVRLQIMFESPYGRRQKVYFRETGGSIEGPQ
jgi:hypothetical protein